MDYPPDAVDAKLVDIPGGWTECFITGHVKRLIYDTPGFARPPLSPPNGRSYRIGSACSKGLGMFATRVIRAGDLILDERPMMVCTVSSSKTFRVTLEVAKLSDEQRRQIVLHEWGKHIKLAFDRMPSENQKAFMEQFNSHEHDGSDEIAGYILFVHQHYLYSLIDITRRVGTNGLMCDLQDKGATGFKGRYTAICKDISRINHCCGPNATWKWHTDTFTVRITATRDIGIGEEITIAYCGPLLSAAERAMCLAPYGILHCKCSPSCSDEARSKIADERRARFPILLIPPADPPKSGEPEDAWVQPAVQRLQELEEEGLEGTFYFTQTSFQLINVYSFLHDVNKALWYANKLKGVWKALEGKDLDAAYSSEEGIKGSYFYSAGETRKKGMPVKVSFI
ncbi:hypothetical protein GYMLUDRAFT_86012 [Collybiopsis luxurians FD-317 M1]|uniref:SET domain-containing protein n=1 Tax=Collybiopsis luxurians FD-317 M1 TaxID=944289 RepID=A0A0D0C988_9AGAR|nr:hypothetical protein GYMLUDRAFT_86012 [Collybiopsis luxurians FD-317 M1]